MKNLLLKVKENKKFPEVKYVSINARSVSVDEYNFEGKDFEVRFEVELLSEEKIPLDYGYGFSLVDLSDINKEEEFYSVDISIKGLDPQKFKTSLITVELTDDQKEVLSALFNTKNKALEKLSELKSHAKKLLGDTKKEQEEFINSFKESYKEVKEKTKTQAKECCSMTRDFVERARTNELTKKEKIFSVAAVGLATIAFLAGKSGKK